jgi:histidinol-phosphate aminotransferase
MILFLCIFIILLIFIFIIYKRVGGNIESFTSNLNFKEFIRNKTILITCSTSGIGYELAKLFSKYECNLIITGKNNVKKTEEELKKLNPNIIGITIDLTDSEQVNSLFKKAVEEFKTIDYLINIPLINTGSKFIREKNIKDWNHDLNANVNAIYQLSQLCVKHMTYYNLDGKILTVIADLDKKKTNNTQSLLQDMIIKYNKMISNELYNSKIAVTTIKIDIPQSSKLYSNLPKNLPKLKSILDIFKSIDSISEVSIKKILKVFIYVMQSPANKMNGKTLSSNIFLNEKYNPELSLIIDENQIHLNNNVYNNIKYQTTKENADYLIKQNPYPPPKNIIKLFEKGGLTLNSQNTHSKYDSKIIELLANENNIKTDNICLFKNEYEALQKIMKIFVGKDSTIVSEYPTWNLLELVCKENNVNIKYVLLTETDDINIQPKLHEITDSVKSSDVKLIYLSSPNIVSGQELLEEDFNKLLKSIPDNIVILIDQTFFDFINVATFNLLKYLDRNIILLRTFNNFYSIENLELSYIISNESFIKFIKDTQVLNPINRFTDTLAVTCLSDKNYKLDIIEKINLEKNRMCLMFEKYNIHYFHSDTNYILVDLSITKEEFIKELEKIDIILYESNDGHASHITLPIGTHEINNKVLDIMVMFS